MTEHSPSMTPTGRANQRQIVHTPQTAVICLREIDTLPGEATISKLIYFPSEKGSTLREKYLFPTGSKYFPIRVEPFIIRMSLSKSCHPYQKWRQIYTCIKLP